MKLKIGVFGAGHLGKIHIQQWKEISDVEIIGFYDPNETQAEQAAGLYQVPCYNNIEQLIMEVDAVDIVTTTIAHYEVAKLALKYGKHVFIEKPLAHTLEQARELVHLVQEAGVKCQVGHVERYNPAFLALKSYAIQPMFIETHRLAEFNPRGTDVSVILDLMIHDIDIILHLVKSSIKRISASGVAVISETADIANARIEFDNGCVANLTSSRISLKKMRKMRLFQKDAYIGIDFLDKKAEVVNLKEPGDPKGMFDLPIETANGDKKIISINMPQVDAVNSIRLELQEFASAILNDTPVAISVYDGFQAMDVAHQVLKKMSVHSEMHNV